MATLVPLPVPRPAKRARLNEDGQTCGDVVALSPQMQQTIVGQPYDIFSCSVVVRIDGELGEVEDSDIAKSLELVQGRYFKIGVFNNRPLYRQEVPSHENAVNTSQLFLYFMDQGHASGWYISEDLECTSTTVHHAWGDSRKDALDAAIWPETMIVPYWRSHKNKGMAFTLRLLHGTIVADHIVSELQAEVAILTEARQRIPRTPEVKDGAEAEEGPSAKSWSWYQHDPNVPKPETPLVKAGWMNRTAPLCLAVLERRWEEVDRLVNAMLKWRNMECEIERVRKKAWK